jgi:DNA-binding phage protein
MTPNEAIQAAKAVSRARREREKLRRKPAMTPKSASSIMNQLFMISVAREMTIPDLARASGITETTLYQYRVGASEPSMVKVEKIARGLGMRFMLVNDE